ncbi:M20/M25/M40 family metallo-hydrolase [Novosphingobium piscinae]|uniref:M20/M25/M40 family metallo-hydrolase n=1 Tax=Novosphingobium piscinae TaxID=1507448 RepID=A0A7X1KQE8_9SPHN|nr:M20/M25/M40 family metallo-hydrolase [Novosphingobium piscinae]MBC2669463.1 M20/M25/M40 family metallo-hydrolase [Novosphingobium piscinae]
MILRTLAPLSLLLSTAALAQAQPGTAPEAVSQARLRADVDRLVGFGTRHTLSSQTDPKRGIGAARTWAEAELRKTSKACGNCLEITLPEKMVSGNRIPTPVRLVNVVAIQRGTERPNEVVIVQAHIDSRRTNEMDFTGDAPGANDDGSGTALVLEAARILSRQRFPTTIVYAVLSGEEQGLYGGRLLAEYAKAQGWTVKAVLNNDIVGNSRGSDGYVDDRHVRVFSEGPRADLDEKTRKAQRAYGGENDSPSRNLSRYIATLAGQRSDGFAVRQVWRADRAGRGGDHLPFEEFGYPAIRFSVAVEDFHRQHQDVRVDNGTPYGDLPEAMDFPYLARVTELNIAALAALARAPMPPVAKADFAVKTYTDLNWTPVAGAARYAIWRRRTDAATWQGDPVLVDAPATTTRFEGLRGDDWVFGVSARAADGSESPIASALPGGQFTPLAP